MYYVSLIPVQPFDREYVTLYENHLSIKLHADIFNAFNHVRETFLFSQQQTFSRLYTFVDVY